MHSLKRITALMTGVALLAITAGCAQKPFPDVQVESVKTFSLGSVKFTPFKTRPTAEQLYKTTLHLYDSFDSVAVTVDYKGQDISEWTEVDEKAENVKVDKRQRVDEYRAIIPNKILTTSRSKDAWVTVRNGDTSINYFSNRNEYVIIKAKEDFPNPATLWAGLLPPQGDAARPFSSIKLLPDQNIKGTEVYVLELKLNSQRFRDGGLSLGGTTTVYLGKNDLLPRRSVYVQDRTDSSAKIIGLPPNTSTSEYLGFVANLKLPEALFPTKPPKGAKQMKDMSVE